METFAEFSNSSFVKPFDKSPSPSRTTDSLASCFTAEGLDFLETMDDYFKEPNSPQQTDSNSTASILDTSRQIIKAPKPHKPRKSRDLAYISQSVVAAEEKRSARKPVHEYEETRKQEEERRKTKRIHKTKEKIKENLSKDVPLPTITEGIFGTICPIISYKNRDWKMFFNQELGTLSHQEFIIFFGLVYERNPECISFEKGFAELKITQPEVESANASGMSTENAIYQALCTCIEEVKKKRN